MIYLTLLLNQERSDSKYIHTRSVEASDSLFRTHNNRLSLHIKRSIHHYRVTCYLLEFLQHVPVYWMNLFFHRLRPYSPINVDTGSQNIQILLPDVTSGNHETRRFQVGIEIILKSL